MNYYTVKNENFFNVKCDDGDVSFNIGQIEKPYHNSNLFFATGSNNVTLKDGNTVIFTDFNKAVKSITEHFENELEVKQ